DFLARDGGAEADRPAGQDAAGRLGAAFAPPPLQDERLSIGAEQRCALISIALLVAADRAEHVAPLIGGLDHAGGTDPVIEQRFRHDLEPAAAPYRSNEELPVL